MLTCLSDIHWWLYRFWLYRRLSWWCNPKTYYLYVRRWYKNYKIDRVMKKAEKLLDKWEREKHEEDHGRETSGQEELR